jgi:hypothetical protein
MTPKQLDALLESFEGVSSSELISALFELEMNPAWFANSPERSL